MKTTILSQLSGHKSIAPFQTITAGNLIVYRGKEDHGNYDVRHGNTTIAGGRIPNSADPATYPLLMAIAAVNAMEFK